MLVLACYRHDGDKLLEAQLRRVQSSSIDCGDAQPDAPRQAVDACMAAAFEDGRPFHARFWKQGIDSKIASGVAFDPQGTLFVYRFDSSPCGAPGRCQPLLEETPCARSYIWEDSSGKHLACAQPRFNHPHPRADRHGPPFSS
jgi:hypothetical protein